MVSPDGNWVAFTLTAYAPGATLPSVDIWLADNSGRDDPRQLTRNAGTDFDPAWAPDSRSIVYAAVPEGANHSQIFLLNLRGGAPQPLTDLPTSASKPRYSADGTMVYFQAGTYPGLDVQSAALKTALADSSSRRQFAKGSNTRVMGGPDQDPNLVQHVFSLDLETQQIRDVMPGQGGTGNVVPFDWDLSPGGAWLAFTANTSPPPYRRRNSDVFLLSLADSTVTNITANNPAEDSLPVFSRAGDDLLYARKSRVDALDEFRTLVRYSHRRGVTKAITDPSLLSPEQWVTSKDGKSVYFLAQQRARRTLFRIGIGGGKARALTGPGSYDGLALGAKDAVYLTHETLLQPPSLQRLDSNGLHPVSLTRFNDGQLQNTRQPKSDEMTFSGADGQEIHALVVYPPGWRETEAWPVVIALHGGPHSAWLDEFSWRWNLALMASRGYLTVALNVRGSTGYGQDFASAVNGDPLGITAADTLAALAQLQQQPYVDPQRVALVGGSFGGMQTLWVLGESTEFSAAVVHAPVVEQAMVFASDFPWGRLTTWGNPSWLTGAPGSRPRSPADRLGLIKTPVLAMHGELDTRVPEANSRFLHNALTEQGVASRLVLFPSQGHLINSPPASKIWWEELFAWLDIHMSR